MKTHLLVVKQAFIFASLTQQPFSLKFYAYRLLF